MYTIKQIEIPSLALAIVGIGIIGWAVWRYTPMLFTNRGLPLVREFVFLVTVVVATGFLFVALRGWRNDAPALPAAVLVAYGVYYVSFRVNDLVGIRNTQLAGAILIFAMLSSGGLTWYLIRRRTP